MDLAGDGWSGSLEQPTQGCLSYRVAKVKGFSYLETCPSKAELTVQGRDERDGLQRLRSVPPGCVWEGQC